MYSGKRSFFFKQKTAYEIRPGDWSSDVCSSDLSALHELAAERFELGIGDGGVAEELAGNEARLVRDERRDLIDRGLAGDEMAVVVELESVKGEVAEALEVVLQDMWARHSCLARQECLAHTLAQPIVRPERLCLNRLFVPDDAAEMFAVRRDGDECESVFVI